jgi:hypothetical protein
MSQLDISLTDDMIKYYYESGFRGGYICGVLSMFIVILIYGCTNIMYEICREKYRKQD